jgi:hypothetical protein
VCLSNLPSCWCRNALRVTSSALLISASLRESMQSLTDRNSSSSLSAAGVALMKIGERAQLICPPDYAYGS